MRRCATCGEAIYDGEIALRDTDGAYYCGASCCADALAEEVVVDGEDDAPYASAPAWTYEQAVRMAQMYERLVRELDEIQRICHGAARDLERQGYAATAVAYRRAAELIERARRSAAWGEVPARCGS